MEVMQESARVGGTGSPLGSIRAGAPVSASHLPPSLRIFFLAEKEKGPSEMKSLLFALGLALCCFVQAEWTEVTTTSEKYLGRWMTIAVACNSSECLEQIKYLTAFAAVVSKPEENVISITASISMPDGCKNVTHQFRKGEDGKYHGVTDGAEVTLESLKALVGFDDEFVMSTVNIDNESRISSLHSRNVTQDQEILQKFKEECKRLGFTEDQIMVLNPTVKCP